MKQLIECSLIPIINSLDEESQNNAYVNAKTYSIWLKNVLDYLMDIQEDEPTTLISRSEYEHYLELQRMYEEEEF